MMISRVYPRLSNGWPMFLTRETTHCQSDQLLTLGIEISFTLRHQSNPMMSDGSLVVRRMTKVSCQVSSIRIRSLSHSGDGQRPLLLVALVLVVSLWVSLLLRLDQSRTSLQQIPPIPIR